MIFRLAGSYDRQQQQNRPVEQDGQIDWGQVHPQVFEYYIRYNQWPDRRTEKRLINGERVE